VAARLTVAFSMWSGVNLFAQPVAEPPIVLDPLTVIAHPSGADERTASVWVVTPDADAPAPTRIADLLLQVPGLHLDQPGGPGGRATLYLRGADENHTVVFFDGVPLNDPTNSRGGAVDFGTIEPALLGSAAVVRGAASVRHGPETLAGVVHFESAAGKRDTVRLEFEGDGDGLRRGVFALQRSAGARSSFGLSGVAVDDGLLDDGSRMQRRFVRGTLAVDAPFSVDLVAWYGTTDSDSFPDDSGGRRFAVLRTLEHREEAQTVGALRMRADWAGRAWTLTADAAEFTTDIDSPGVAPGLRDPAGLPATLSAARLRRVRVNTLVEHVIAPWTFSGGVDFQREQGRDDSTLDFGVFALPSSFRADRTRAGVFAEASGELRPGLTVNGGARLDRYDDGFTRGTVRAGLLGTIDSVTQWRINGGSGFKPPSFYALANPLVGNPALRPERARTLDAGLRRTFGDGRGLLDLSVFSTRFRDGIDFDPGPPPRLVNRDGIRSRGAEAALQWRLSEAFALGSALTYTDARSLPDEERMRSRPRWRGSLFATWQAHRDVTVRATAVAVGGVPDTSIPTGAAVLDNWARLDLAAVWRVRPGLELTLGADNALDANYEEAVGFTAPGRRLRAGLRAEF
jgi:vitamin B12 transporter